MVKVSFFSNVNRPPQRSTPCGRREIEDYQLFPDADSGDKKLDVVGKIDMYEKTQLSRPDDLYTLLQKSGVEPSAIESLKVTKAYAQSLLEDFCSAPRTLVEAHEVIHRAEQSFDQLPLEVKAEFDNSSGKMLKSLEDGTFVSRVARFYPKLKKDEEDKDNEVK